MADNLQNAPDPSQRAPVPKLLSQIEVDRVTHIRPQRHTDYYDQNPLLSDAIILQVCLQPFLTPGNPQNTLAVWEHPFPDLPDPTGCWKPFFYGVICNSWYQS